jgi:hypothetical protein
MKITYRDLKESIHTQTLVSYDDLNNEERKVRENQNMTCFNKIQNDKIIASNNSSRVTPMNRANINMTNFNYLSPSHESKINMNETVTFEMSNFKGVKVTVPLKSFIDSKTNTSSNFKEYISNIATSGIKSDTTSVLSNYNESVPILNNHTRFASVNSTSSRLFSGNFYQNETESKNQNNSSQNTIQVSPTKKAKIIRVASIKKKIFVDEEDNREIELKRKRIHLERMNNINDINSGELPTIKNRKIISNIKKWENTLKKKKSTFNSGSFNLPLYVIKKKQV